MEVKRMAGTPKRTMRVPWACKVIFALAGLVFFFPGLCIMVVHRFVPSVPQHMSLGDRIFVAMLGPPIALVGLVPVLWIESRRGD